MHRMIPTNGTTLNVHLEGSGTPLVLLHGWPHTWRVWQPLIPLLAGRRVIAPDLRGLGDSAPSEAGLDAATGVLDVLGLLDALGIEQAEVAAIDASVTTAFLLAAGHPGRVGRLTLMEGLLPGGFPVPPWWFGFHAIPGLAEAVVAGSEAEYLGFFLTAGSYRGVPADIRDAFVAAYTGRDRLRRGFGFYRAANVVTGRLTVPTLAIGGSVIGERLHQQLTPLADDLRGVVLDRCAHLVPIDRPDALARLLTGSPALT
jgi:pimeloyl-ACP methyl ester carboxylesterase